MKLNYLILLVLLFLSACFSTAAAGLNPKDGTFLLRQRREELDYQLKKQFLQNPASRLNLKLNAVEDLVLHETEVGFQVYNFVSGTYQYCPGIFVGEGQRCRIFLEKGQEGTLGPDHARIIQQIVDNFDQHVFPTVTAWFGQPYVPSEFYLRDEKIFIFLVDIQDNFTDGYIAGYFDHRDIDGLFGNQKPVFFMDTNPGKPGNPSDKANHFYRTLAHEFQHMVSFSRRLERGLTAQDRWLDEGFSMFSEFVYSGRVGENAECLPPSPHYEKFVENPEINLLSSSNNSWFKEEQLFRQYGASFLFTTYLIEKYGGTSLGERQGFVRKLIDQADSGAAGLNEFLSSYNTSLTEVFQNWVLACYLNDSSLNQGKWHFSTLRIYENAEVAQLPLKCLTHYYASQSGSFLGGEGRVLPNQVNLEEIRGEALARVKFSFEDGMTPALVSVDNHGSVTWRQLSSGKNATTVECDLQQLQRLFLLPVAVNPDNVADESLAFSFSSQANGLILYPVANPAFTDQFIIFLRSSQESLVATPTLRISLNNLVDSPKFTPIDPERRIFAAHYRLPGNGRGQALCFAGEDSCSFSFSAAAVRGNQTVIDGEDGTSLLLASTDERLAGAAMISPAPINFELIKKNIVAGPFDIVLAGNSSATLTLKMASDSAAIGLAKIEPWNELSGWQRLNKAGENASARVTDSGRFCLVKDDQPPAIQRLTNKTSANRNLIELTFNDELSGIDAATARLKIEKLGEFTPCSSSSDTVLFSLPQTTAGNYQLTFEIADLAGNWLRENRRQTLAGKTRLQSCNVFPNPSRGRSRLHFSFSAPVDLLSASIKIFDQAGDLVAELDAIQVGADRVEAIWDGCNAAGKKVANGLYFIKGRLNTVQGVFKAVAKAALLR